MPPMRLSVKPVPSADGVFARTGKEMQYSLSMVPVPGSLHGLRFDRREFSADLRLDDAEICGKDQK